MRVSRRRGVATVGRVKVVTSDERPDLDDQAVGAENPSAQLKRPSGTRG